MSACIVRVKALRNTPGQLEVNFPCFRCSIQERFRSLPPARGWGASTCSDARVTCCGSRSSEVEGCRDLISARRFVNRGRGCVVQKCGHVVIDGGRARSTVSLCSHSDLGRYARLVPYPPLSMLTERSALSLACVQGGNATGSSGPYASHRFFSRPFIPLSLSNVISNLFERRAVVSAAFVHIPSPAVHAFRVPTSLTRPPPEDPCRRGHLITSRPHRPTGTAHSLQWRRRPCSLLLTLEKHIANPFRTGQCVGTVCVSDATLPAIGD